MLSGKVTLPILIGLAIAATAWMKPSNSVSPEIEKELKVAKQQIQTLESELLAQKTLKSDDSRIDIPALLLAKVEQDFSLRFLTPPTIQRISDEKIGDRIEAYMDSIYGPGGLEDRQEAYRLIGWLAPDDDFFQQSVAVKSVGANAWFDDQMGQGWVTNRFAIKNITDQAILIRLLVRILIHQHFPPQASYPGDEVARTREAIHMGLAAGAEMRFFANSARSIGFLPQAINTSTQRLFMSLPDYLKRVTLFPAEVGKDYTEKAYMGGAESLKILLKNPPSSTWNLLIPALDKAPVKRVNFSNSEKAYLMEKAGYLGLRSWLALVESSENIEELSRCWTDDQYFLMEDTDETATLVWEIQLSNSAAMDLLEKYALSFIEHKPQQGRYLGIYRISSNTLRFFNTASKITAEKWSKP